MAVWVFLTAATVVVVAAFTYSKGQAWFTGYSSPQWAAAGSWISSFTAVFAAGVALYQARNARKDARQAQLLAATDMADRAALDQKKTEYDAVGEILRSVADLLIALYTYIEQAQTMAEINDIIAKDKTLSESEKTMQGLKSIEQTNALRHRLTEVTNNSLISCRLTLLILENNSLHEAADLVMKRMTAVRNVYQHAEPTDGVINFNEAAATAQKMNEASLRLQEVAEMRFRHADDSIPSPEAPSSKNGTDRDAGTDKTENR